jgi:hypothetical protein
MFELGATRRAKSRTASGHVAEIRITWGFEVSTTSLLQGLLNLQMICSALTFEVEENRLLLPAEPEIGPLHLIQILWHLTRQWLSFESTATLFLVSQQVLAQLYCEMCDWLYIKWEMVSSNAQRILTFMALCDFLKSNIGEHGKALQDDKDLPCKFSSRCYHYGLIFDIVN